MERCQVICHSSILSPGLLHIPQSCLPLPSPSPCRAAPQGKVLAKVAAGMPPGTAEKPGKRSWHHRGEGWDAQSSTGTPDRVMELLQWWEHGGIWPQMEMGAALTAFWKIHGTRQSTGRFPQSVCIHPWKLERFSLRPFTSPPNHKQASKELWALCCPPREAFLEPFHSSPPQPRLIHLLRGP